MNLIELDDYTLAPAGSSHGLAPCHISIGKNDVWAIEADFIDDAHQFLRGLATLDRPVSGTYRYQGQIVDFNNHQMLLELKRKIGFIAPDTSLISNRTLRENLLLMRYYDENSLNITLDDKIYDLCRKFDLYDKLDQRPGQLLPNEFRTAIAIREISKPLELLLLDRPEDVVAHDRIDLFADLLQSIIDVGHPVVLYTSKQTLVSRFAKATLQLKKGCLTMLN
jgi:ABC-type lipoprotein export system ATPase subunit